MSERAARGKNGFCPVVAGAHAWTCGDLGCEFCQDYVALFYYGPTEPRADIGPAEPPPPPTNEEP